MDERQQYNILYSCTGEASRVHDPFVREHALSCITCGSVDFYSPKGTVSYGPGTMGLTKRNQLVKTMKRPGPDGPFTSISIMLDQASLRQYSIEHQIKTAGPYTGEPIILLPSDPFLKGYFESLMPYFERPGQLTETLARAKTIEAIELLLRNPSFKELLFDFSEPFKIDIEAYMNRHYTYNVPMAQFAKLTGRSLATFKRDFQRIFRNSPERWLKQKRLELAHFLIAKQNEAPGEAYLNAGFENLSHFSTSFKRYFGYSPSSLTKG